MAYVQSQAQARRPRNGLVGSRSARRSAERRLGSHFTRKGDGSECERKVEDPRRRAAGGSFENLEERHVGLRGPLANRRRRRGGDARPIRRARRDDRFPFTVEAAALWSVARRARIVRLGSSTP